MKDTIKAHVQRAHDLARSKIERMARRILREHPKLESFVMAMGAAFFIVKDDQRHNLGLDEKSYFRPLDRLLDEWDDTLHLTGNPMWIEGPDGIIKTAW